MGHLLPGHKERLNKKDFIDHRSLKERDTVAKIVSFFAMTATEAKQQNRPNVSKTLQGSLSPNTPGWERFV